MLRTTETRYISWHETCACKCRLDASVCNDRQHWSNDKCSSECKEFMDKARYDDEFMWNPIYVNVNVINHAMLVNLRLYKM